MNQNSKESTNLKFEFIDLFVKFWNKRFSQPLYVHCTKPSNWSSEVTEEFIDYRDRTNYKEPIIQRVVSKVFTLDYIPKHMYGAKHLEKDGFYPSITLWDEPLYHRIPEDQIKRHTDMIVEKFAIIYEDVELINSPMMIQLKNQNASMSKWKYKHTIDEDTTFNLEVITILVFRKGRVNTWYIVDLYEKNLLKKEVIDRFVGSIEYK